MLPPELVAAIVQLAAEQLPLVEPSPTRSISPPRRPRAAWLLSCLLLSRPFRATVERLLYRETAVVSLALLGARCDALELRDGPAMHTAHSRARSRLARRCNRRAATRSGHALAQAIVAHRACAKWPGSEEAGGLAPSLSRLTSLAFPLSFLARLLHFSAPVPLPLLSSLTALTLVHPYTGRFEHEHLVELQSQLSAALSETRLAHVEQVPVALRAPVPRDERWRTCMDEAVNEAKARGLRTTGGNGGER